MPRVQLADKYTYRVIWSDEDNEFVGLCAEFPSLSWLDESREGALSGIVKLVRETLAEMAANREKPPIPVAAQKYSGVFKVRIPPVVHRNLAIEAAECGVSLNRLVSAKLAHG
jgi:predicted HicB family RNase H-like nuclease